MGRNQTTIRVLSWLKGRLVPKGPRTYQVPVGLFRGLRFELDLQNQTQLYLGLWEHETYRYMRKAASDCDWMIDIGAGRGELCIFFLKASRVQRVIAVEPQVSEVTIMRDNLTRNECVSGSRLEIIQKFVGTMTTPDYMALDDLDLPTHQRGFIKIDVDGYEIDVLNSGQQLLSSSQVDLLIETHSEPLERACLDWLIDRGYWCQIIKNAWWRAIIPEQRPIAHNRWLWATRYRLPTTEGTS